MSSPGSQAGRALDHVMQLAHVAGKSRRVRASMASGAMRVTRRPSARAWCSTKCAAKIDVLAPLAQRGLDPEDVQPEERSSRSAGLDLGGEVTVGGGDDADIDLHLARRPDGLDLAFLQHPQQRTWTAGLVSAISSRKSVPPSRSRRVPSCPRPRR
jgi:hypothetical protein